MSGAKVNLTVHESSEAGDKVMEVRLRLEEAVINIRYSDHSHSSVLTTDRSCTIYILIFKNRYFNLEDT